MKTSLKTIVATLVFGSIIFTLIQFSGCNVDNGPLSLCELGLVIQGPDTMWHCDQFDYYVTVDNGARIQPEQWSVSGDMFIFNGQDITPTEDGPNFGVEIVSSVPFGSTIGHGTITLSGQCRDDHGNIVSSVLATKNITIVMENPITVTGSLCLNDSGLGEGTFVITDKFYYNDGVQNLGDSYEIVYTPTTDQADITWIEGTLTIEVKNFKAGDLPVLEFGVIKHGANCKSLDVTWVDAPLPTQACQ